jgi:hypothetical protein
MAEADVIYVDSDVGAALFDSADVKGHFWTLCRYFISENFLTYCGIASSVTVLNSLGIEAPDSPQIYPYRMFTQDNIFTDEVLHHRRPLEVEKGGNTLEQLASIVGVFNVRVDALKSPERRVIVDFNRQALHQKGSGHFSPLAAYHAGEDRFLLMDVARYKSPPCWVKAEVLYKALASIDSVSQKSRGFLIVRRRETRPTVSPT